MLDFSVSGLCRRHGFGSVTQVCFGISVSNFMCMSFVAVGKDLKIFSYIAVKMAALWFWAMFNCNPPIAPCYPLPWGGGSLVDHWSTISSLQWLIFCTLCICDIHDIAWTSETKNVSWYRICKFNIYVVDCWLISQWMCHSFPWISWCFLWFS